MSDVEPLKWTVTNGDLKVGDRVSITGPWYERRKWWQFWKPKCIDHPAETRTYRIVAKSTSTHD